MLLPAGTLALLSFAENLEEDPQILVPGSQSVEADDHPIEFIGNQDLGGRGGWKVTRVNDPFILHAQEFRRGSWRE